MREIMFRGKRIDNGAMIHGYLFKIWERTYILWGTTNDVPNMVEVDPETVGQRTGMKDKKFDGHEPEEIYEGDIIMCPISNKYFMVEYDDYGGSWMFCELGKSVGEGYYEFEEISSFWMVCGNIHENPELLKGA